MALLSREWEQGTLVVRSSLTQPGMLRVVGRCSPSPLSHSGTEGMSGEKQENVAPCPSAPQAPFSSRDAQLDVVPGHPPAALGGAGCPQPGLFKEPRTAVIPNFPSALSDVCFLLPPQGYDYIRSGNPTRDCLEKAVAALDGAKYCLAYSSGLAALLNICHLLKPEDTVICMDDVYGGTNRYFQKIASENNLKVIFVDCTKPKCLEAAITPETKLVWLETPTNPTLKVIDIRACADIVRRHPGVLLAVDNSFMSAYFQRPLALGADICMCSATKYINGHSDVLMGLVSVNRDDLYERLKFLQNSLGAVPSPFDCFLCNRGLKTLHIRMKLHFHNGLAVAKFLESHPRVEKVIYPGLPSHPQYEVMKKQCTGCPGMVSFHIKGNIKNASAFLRNLKVFTLAESLGGFESLAEHPAIMTHASVPEEERKTLGITDTLIRLSVGLEDEEDLLADLGQALDNAFE